MGHTIWPHLNLFPYIASHSVSCKNTIHTQHIAHIFLTAMASVMCYKKMESKRKSSVWRLLLLFLRTCECKMFDYLFYYITNFCSFLNQRLILLTVQNIMNNYLLLITKIVYSIKEIKVRVTCIKQKIKEHSLMCIVLWM